MATVGVKKGAGGQDGFQNGFQEVAKMVQDAAKTREHESNKCGHSRQIRCFCKVGPIQRQRRAIMDLWNKYWTEVDPTDGTKSPNVAIVGVQKCVDGQDGLQNGFQEVAHTVQNGAEMGQDAAKTRENESKKCGHSRQIRCFCKVGTIQRQRRAKNVLMKRVLNRGRINRREKEAKCGHCRGPKV